MDVEESFVGNWNKQMKKGLLIFLVMNVIKKKNCYGYEIIQKIERKTGIIIADGTLYPLLKKLKSNKLVLTRWEVSEEDAPRKYYYLTGTGNGVLQKMNTYWGNLNQSVCILIEE